MVANSLSLARKGRARFMFAFGGDRPIDRLDEIEHECAIFANDLVIEGETVLENTKQHRRIRDAALRLFSDSGSRSINVSELAQAAGVSRGTVYNNIAEPEQLFEDIAGSLTHEMFVRTTATLGPVDDPVVRTGLGMRLFVRRAHEEPAWGAFLIRFALIEASLSELFFEPPAHDIRAGSATGGFTIREDQVMGAVSLVASATLGAMLAVRDGRMGWRDAGSTAAELTLRGLGVPAETARSVSLLPLPDLADAPQ